MRSIDQLTDHLQRFPERHHDKLVTCLFTSPRMAQLVYSNSLLFFLIATDYWPEQQRRDAIALINRGRPMAEVCACMGIPLCLRRLPPEVCRMPLPFARWNAHSNRELASLVPKDPHTAALWLAVAFVANNASDEAFGLWMARQKAVPTWRRIPAFALQAIGLYAWCSRFSPTGLASNWAVPWTDDIGLDTAASRAGLWAREISILADLGASGLTDPWIGPTKVEAFSFVPILTPVALMDEARIMSNCVATYSLRLQWGASRLFSVQRDGSRVATIELRYCDNRLRYFLAEVRGPHNATPPLELVHAAHQWIERHAPAVPPARQHATEIERTAKIANVLSAYRDAHPEVTPDALRGSIERLLQVDMMRAELWASSRVPSKRFARPPEDH
jgi:hypothetical protein